VRKQITGYEVGTALTDRLKHSTYHTFPGIVVAFYPGAAGKSPASVDVQVAVNDVRTNTDTQAIISEPWPVLSKVPVRYPKGGGFIIQFPLAAGDKVTLTSYDLDPTGHRQSGKQADPIDVRRHAGGYWSCSPDDITDPGAPVSSAAAGTSLVVGKDGSTQQIVFNGTTIALGNPAADFVALASKVETELNKIAACFAAFIPAAGTGVTGGLFPPTSVYGGGSVSVGPVASSLVASG
jgi:hypothetical protein